MRESLSRLSADGLVVAEGQKGFAVRPVSVEDLREITRDPAPSGMPWAEAFYSGVTRGSESPSG